MARPSTPSKGNPIQTFLMIGLIWLAMIMFLKPGQQPTSPTGKPLTTRTDYFATLQDQANQIHENTASQLIGGFFGAVDADVKAKRITQQEGDAEKIQGATLVADADLRAGQRLNNSNKVRMGYQTLQGWSRKNSTNPGWSAPMELPDPSNFRTTQLVQMSPKAFFEQMTQTLSDRNKTDLVWGFIPGGYQAIDFLVRLTGKNPNYSYWIASLLLAVVLRAIVWPLSQKQLMFSRQMSQLTPRINEIKKQYEGNQTETQQRTMALYREYGINPFQGCLPAFVQMPLFLTVYQCMLHYQFEFRNGFFLWVNPATSAATHGFFAPNLGEQDYILILIYGITMTVSTLLTPVTDPTQAKTQRMMGVGMSIAITAFMFLGLFPVVSGFVLYWIFLNLLATVQAFRAYRLPMPPLVKVNTPNGGVYPTSGIKGRWMQMMEEAQRMQSEQRGSGNSLPPPTRNEPSKAAGSNGKAQKNGKPDTGDTDTKSSGQKPKYKPKKRN
jgi:YidC/Oxa1 family membrane protein insertase